jgi:hypothetical protein
MKPRRISLAATDRWPTWTNAPLVLFHGTTRTYAENVETTGVDLTRCRDNTDFGRGFYATTQREHAVIMAESRSSKRNDSPRIVRFTLNRNKLANFKAIAFVQGNLNATDFWSFIFHCRQGRSQRPPYSVPYDVVYGPVARTWWGPSNFTLWKGYDQVSFHTQAAVDFLNNDGACIVEKL